jgi:hypothetical protein
LTSAILSLLYGAAAGFFLPVGGFALGLLALLAAIGFALSGATSVWGAVGVLVASAVFAQIGYFTAVYYRATVIGAKRAQGDMAEQPAGRRREPQRLAEHAPTED